ncbi:MAG: YitT family protein [Eubacteriales bacterium]|nr:YitT family protein [Eubacteriales bacterium]
MKNTIAKDVRRIAVICFAAVILAVNIKTFVRTGGLYPGGATGLTILIQTAGEKYFHMEIPYTLINVLLNSIPVYIGFRYIGKKFTLYSCLMIVLSGVLADIIPARAITNDMLLISVFGGIINGLVVCMCLMVNATTGGTDFISIYLSEKKGVDSWNLILGLNAVIISIAGLMFGWEKALYSIIFQFASTQVLHTLYMRYQKQTLFIVTDKPVEVCNVIYETCRHGATILEGEGSYGHCERHVVYSVVSREEFRKVIRAVKRTDEHAFVNSLRTDELSGRFYKKPTDE